ncbi:hypothetical protein DRO59_10120 [Candidatus Bathyarchaeota archaeon]|nr:MAG: hypothetical protein DRO59_10120 [Candidatus Bathyarchaeota archaeon]
MRNLSYPKISLPAKANPQAIKKVNNLIRRLNYIKAKDEEFFELNGGSLDILQLLQFLQQAKTMGSYFKGITATRKELREGGYFHTAKLIVLRNLWREKKGLLSIEEGTYTLQEQTTTTKKSILPF